VTTIANQAPSPVSPPRTRSRARLSVLRKPIALVCSVYLLLLVIAVLAAPILAPGDPNLHDLSSVLAGPGGVHWLGTDQLGRDVFSRLLHGGGVALLDVATAVLTSLVIGVPLGIAAGYLGGWTERIITRVADLVFAVPGIVVLLMVVAIFPGNDLVAMVTLGLLHAPGLLRIVRASTLACRRELFVTAAGLSGLRAVTIMRRHIVPSLAGPIIVQTSLFCASALVIESGLSFLGLLRPDSSGPSWGNMVSQAARVSSQAPWLLVPAGTLIAITVLAFSLLGDAIRDATVGRSVPVVALRAPAPSHPTSSAEPGSGLLQVRGLDVTLRRGGVDVPVLRDVNFTIEPGESIGIVGESGCGKSTTAKAILGLLPAGGRVTAGAVHFDGKDLTHLTEKGLSQIRGSGIALISQDAISSLDPAYTVGSQLREVIIRHTGLARKQADERATELLRMVRFPDPAAILSRRAHELSGGMAQRIGIAMAIAAGPKLLIADEPTSALDVTVQAEILALLRDLRRQLGMALIIVTHDWGVLADVCDRTLVMYAGEIVESATVEQIYTAAGHPYSAALLASNPQLAKAGEPLPTIAGRVPEPGRWPGGCHFEPRCALATDACASKPIPLTPLPDDRASRCIRTEQLLAGR
jgi:peptide/nickel transport system permease protein